MPLVITKNCGKKNTAKPKIILIILKKKVASNRFAMIPRIRPIIPITATRITTKYSALIKVVRGVNIQEMPPKIIRIPKIIHNTVINIPKIQTFILF